MQASCSDIYCLLYPNVNAVAKNLAGGSSSRVQQLIAYVKSCVQPAYKYFEENFGTDLKLAVFVFKCARYFDPTKINELKPSMGDLDELQLLPFFSTSAIANLKQELSAYIA